MGRQPSPMNLPAVRSIDTPASVGEMGVRERTVGDCVVEHQARHVLPDGRSHLESMAGTAADEPDIVGGGMAIEEEVGVGGIFVLADAALDDGLCGEDRKPPPEKFAGAADRLRRYNAIDRRWID